MIERNHAIQIVLTPEELATEFCGMSSSQQALFFNAVAAISKEWIYTQLAYIAGDSELTKEGRYLMRLIGEYAELTEKQ